MWRLGFAELQSGEVQVRRYLKMGEMKMMTMKHMKIAEV